MSDWINGFGERNSGKFNVEDHGFFDHSFLGVFFAKSFIRSFSWFN